MNNPTAILDIGSSKVVCLIGARSSHGGLELYGSASAAHGGLRKGAFLDLEQLREGIEQVVQEAEKEARRNIKTLFIGMPCSLMDTSCNRIKLNYQEMHKFDEDDAQKLIDSAIPLQKSPEKWDYLESYVEHYEIDGTVYRTEPFGILGKQIMGVVTNSYVEKEFSKFLAEVLSQMNISIAAFVDSAYAQADLLIPEKAEAEDDIIIDIGYYQTSLVVLRNRAPIYRTCLEIGGYQIASDISYVLDIAPAAAEAIKRRHVFGLDYMGQHESYPMTDGGYKDCDYETIQNIIEARTREIGDLLADEINRAPVNRDGNVSLYVTGGGVVMMRGGSEFLQNVLPMPIQKVSPVLPKRNSANYYSAYGVLEAGIEHEAQRRGRNWFSAIFRAIVEFFTK